MEKNTWSTDTDKACDKIQQPFPFKISLSKCRNYLNIIDYLTNSNSKYGETQKTFYLKLVLDRVAHQHHFYGTLSLSF